MIKAFLDRRLLKKRTKYFFNKFTFVKQFNKNKLKLKDHNLIINNVNEYGIFKKENFLDKNLINDLSNEFNRIVSAKLPNERNQVQLTPEEGYQNEIFNRHS